MNHFTALLILCVISSTPPSHRRPGRDDAFCNNPGTGLVSHDRLPIWADGFFRIVRSAGIQAALDKSCDEFFSGASRETMRHPESSVRQKFFPKLLPEQRFWKAIEQEALPSDDL